MQQVLHILGKYRISSGMAQHCFRPAAKSLEEKMKGITVEEITWTCSCGSPMGLELNGQLGRHLMVCIHCGPVGGIKLTMLSLEHMAPHEISNKFTSVEQQRSN